MSERDSYPVSEWCERNKTSVGRAYRAIADGKLLAIRLWDGGPLRIPHEYILELVKESMVQNQIARQKESR